MIGQSIQQYRIEELLGEGGMGTVYRGTDTILDRPVAIKVLHSHLLRDGSFLERFRNEAIILGRLNHPNIANLYSFQQQGAQWYMIMEYVDGPTFEQLLRQGGALSVEKAVQLMTQVLEGLQHAHSRGVLHRDIKPANLMLTREGKVKLMDFGIARVVGAQRLTRMNHVVGTLEYMAPELIEGHEPSVQSDLYAAGVLFYELLSGKLPFEASTESALISAIVNKSPIPLSKQILAPPRGGESILARLLQKKAEKRFGSADEFRLALAALACESTSKRAYTPPQTRVLTGSTSIKKWFSDILPPHLKTNPLGKISKGKLMSPETAILAVAFLIALAILLVGEKYLKRTPDSVKVPADTMLFIKPTDHFQALSLSASDSTHTALIEEVPKSETAQPQLTTVPLGQRIVLEEPVTEPRKEQERTKVPQEKKQSTKKETSTPADDNVAAREEKKEEKKSEVPEKSDAVVEETKPTPVIPTVTTHRIALRGEPVLLELVETLSSDGPLTAGKSVRLRAVSEVVSQGITVIASGAPATGTITKVRPAAGNSRSFLEFELDKVQAVNGQWVPLKNPPIGRSGSSLQAVEFVKSTRISAKVGTISLTIKSLN